jgi:hypothetical protein
MKTQTLLVRLIGILLLLNSCVDGRNFDAPEIACSSNLVANSTYAQVKALFLGETLQIQEDLIIEGFVISSDKAGNFFSVLHFQDIPENPTDGFQIEIDIRDTHLFYPVGSKIFIKLKGLYLGKSRGIFKIGGVFTSFGNASVGRLPASIVNQHIFIACVEKSTIVPTEIALDDDLDAHLNTLVKINRVEVILEEIGLTFSVDAEESERTLIDCNDQEIILLNSGFSDFQPEILPEGSGTITALLQKENNDYFLVVNDKSDLNFSQDRCEDFVDEFTSTRVFISEIADPNNNLNARFIELYNSDTNALSLKGWRLNRYTDANILVVNSLDLSAYTLEAQGTLVIAANASVFEAVYGFAPDLVGGANSAANSDGNDKMVLVDPFGNQIDVFGVVGQNSTGTNYFFRDGRALRKPEIEFGNPVYTFSEWLIFNDTGGSGTTNLPQNAPQDFSPKIR